ncbi:MAG: (2Fe-2S)-binding protein [Nitrospinota bacterium]|nr:(2Fe-2S)-binding protein [Nitrospinota bacterium]MDP6620349.1 (2Fe-2S)-binding protein [Nitrospinota bacterium]MDP7387094.1 (2Fe-2S)-binding protein [Nitrospinota bacterium]HJM42595.1 (2Fe-2S)-binding protein [Nitrospinota bacterium]
MDRKTIRFSVNDEPVELTVPVNRFLSEVLRDDLELTGTKVGCDVGVCGCCTVLMGGGLACSCLIPAVRADGTEVRTIEGVADGDALHPVQEAFVECGAVQCGFCTPAMVLTSISLLDEIPNPDRGQIREALHGNYCRCTGYIKIIDAIELAAKRMGEVR